MNNENETMKYEDVKCVYKAFVELERVIAEHVPRDFSWQLVEIVRKARKEAGDVLLFVNVPDDPFTSVHDQLRLQYLEKQLDGMKKENAK